MNPALPWRTPPGVPCSPPVNTFPITTYSLAIPQQLTVRPTQHREPTKHCYMRGPVLSVRPASGCTAVPPQTATPVFVSAVKKFWKSA
jgi:hypothetical protein